MPISPSIAARATPTTTAPRRPMTDLIRLGPAPCPRRSVRVTVAEAIPDRLDENPQVEGEAPPLDIVKIAFDPPLDRGVPPPAVDLGPAGDARLHLVAEHVTRHTAPELFDEAGSLRSGTDQAHVAPQHIEELRQLVKTPAPQESAQPRPARIVGSRPHRPGLSLGVHPHRAKLQHSEASSVDAHSLLAVQHGTRRGELDRDHDSEHRGRG